MMALLGRPVFPDCDWLWRYVSPVVLLGLLISIFVYLVQGPLVYMAWDSSTVSAPSQVLGLLPVPCELRTWPLALITENSPASLPLPHHTSSSSSGSFAVLICVSLSLHSQKRWFVFSQCGP